MGLKGMRDRNEPSDIESEREALRRQRAEVAAELETLKRTVSERVVAVQQRERELAEALARVEKREEKLAAAEARGSRFDSVRLKLAEAKETRGALDARRPSSSCARRRWLQESRRSWRRGRANPCRSPR